jgi:ATP-binding cassette subfamily C (CFTR/MRP) protein 1
MLILSAANAKTALDRLAKFIDIPSFTLPRLSSTNGGVSVDDASFSWPTPSDDVPTSTKHRGPEADELSPPGESMQHIEPNPLAQGEKEMASAAPAAALAASSFSVAPGELLVVVGRVGCFKSTLLQGLLGEARRTGTVRLPWGQMAYCSQQAWLCNASVRDNITFGKPFDEVWFRQVRLNLKEAPFCRLTSSSYVSSRRYLAKGKCIAITPRSSGTFEGSRVRQYNHRTKRRC